MIVLIAISVLIADQISKLLLSRFLPLNETFPIIQNLFHLTLVHNTGIAFGALKGNSGIILGVTIIGLILIAYSVKKDIFSSGQLLSPKVLFLRKISIGFILGGAFGNMVDRLRLGYVVDFLDFRIWPVFNLADSFITIGAVILFWNLFISEKITRK